jgi:hypothetical protein
MTRLYVRVAFALIAFGMMMTVPDRRPAHATSSLLCASGGQQVCSTYTLTPVSPPGPSNPPVQSFHITGGAGSFRVDTGPNGGSCNWTATTGLLDDWITGLPQSEQTGDQTVVYSVRVNSGGPRTAHISAASRSASSRQSASARGAWSSTVGRISKEVEVNKIYFSVALASISFGLMTEIRSSSASLN